MMCALAAGGAVADRVASVDPFIGTGGHGHVFIGANVPFGLVQLGPSQPVKGWDWCSGYHYSDSVMRGFSHTHLSGTGIGDLGDVLVLPANRRGVRSVSFSHANEKASPGFYAVNLPDAGVNVELTATRRTGWHRYTFAPSDSAFLRLDLLYGIGWDNPRQTRILEVNDSTVAGYRCSHGWADDQRIYFVARFSRPAVNAELSDTVATFAFAPSARPLLVKVGISAVDLAGARANLKAEGQGWDFDAVAADARKDWNDNLGRIDARFDNPRDERIFYTALFHTMTAPSVFNDVDGTYCGADRRRHRRAGNTYTTLSLWDTYRAAHPLYTLILPEMQQDLAQTFIDICDQQGKLPVWHLHGNETNCMVGNPGIIVLADLTLKGLAPDTMRAFEAMRKSAELDERGLADMKKLGYVAYDGTETKESVAKGLEYAIADAGIAEVARRLGLDDEARKFERRSEAFKRYYDPATGFMRALDSKGNFRSEKLNPFLTNHREDDYCEGTAWQYAWLVPQAPRKLIALHSSPERFTQMLDSLFIVEGDMGEGASPDVSGLIGQYAHGNEPGHHTIYLYNYAGRPDKAAPLLRKVMTELYTDAPDGLCGNEDVGQMSAWYILSAIGLYQVEPSGGKFVIGSPLVSEADVKVGQGRTFRIVAQGNSPRNIYVQGAALNGKPLNRSWLSYDEIMQGGTLTLTMGPEPSRFGTSPDELP